MKYVILNNDNSIILDKDGIEMHLTPWAFQPQKTMFYECKNCKKSYSGCVSGVTCIRLLKQLWEK